MTPKAILFGSIGTLVETSEIQREAFNKAFSDVGLDWHWDRDFYRTLLEASGGQDRIKKFAAAKGVNVNAAEIYKAKTENFHEALKEGGLNPREGVMHVIEDASEMEIKLGFVTTTSQANIDTVFNAIGNRISKDRFQFIGRNDMVAIGKPSPDIYHKALEALDVKAADAVAIEDTSSGLAASVDAGIATIAFPGENSTEHNYSSASFVTRVLHPDQFETVKPVGRANISQDFGKQKASG